ncbi:hypothetical protein KFF05_17510 [bacterium SCSIO 12827]|nr:hypothetical protein KFF05_17510 [bacterium SCSIO 12827]
MNLADQFRIEDWDWWENRNLAERGPLSSTFTAECCRMVLFGECLEDGGTHLFVVEARDLARLLVDESTRRGAAVSWIGPGVLSRGIGRICRQGIAALRFARTALRRAGRLRRLQALRRRHPLDLQKLAGCDVLLAAWTAPGDFPPQGTRDTAHYMGALPRLLRDAGLKVGYVALPLDWIYDGDAIQIDVAACNEAAMLADDAVSLGALWRAAAAGMRLRARAKPDMAITGQRLAAVADMVLDRERFDWRAVNARLLAEVGPFLARHGCHPQAICHVYENQTWEKGLRTGLRRALPRTRIAGFHQSPFSKMYLNMLPSRAEIANDRWPDIVFTHGARSRRQLTSTGAPQTRVLNAGLFREGSFILQRVAGAGSHGKLIAATGADFQECCELVAKAAAATAGGSWSLQVNFHPATPPSFREGIRRFIDMRGLAGAHVVFTEQSIAELLKNGADAILYADTNAAFEAVSSGARAINVERDHALSFDKLPDGLSRQLYTVTEIRAALDDLADETGWPAANVVDAALADGFSSPDISEVLSALQLGAARGPLAPSATDKVMER